jgi:hypothetical protein
MVHGQKERLLRAVRAIVDDDAELRILLSVAHWFLFVHYLNVCHKGRLYRIRRNIIACRNGGTRKAHHYTIVVTTSEDEQLFSRSSHVCSMMLMSWFTKATK